MAIFQRTSVSQTGYSSYHKKLIDVLFKRLFDISASLIALILLSPIFILVALLIKMFTCGPVFFRQIRAGRHGKPFVIYKFRTMYVYHSDGTISIKGEARITPIGAKLRMYKLDELPELWNVLKGEMSFVGPRPDMPEYADKLEGEELLILELRPGITGPATLKYVNEEELLATVSDPRKYNDEVIWPDKVRINMEYYHNRNFWADIDIILRTIFKIRSIRNLIDPKVKYQDIK